MKRSLLIVGLVLSLAGSGFPASAAPVRYTLMFHTPERIISPGGVVAILRVTGVIGGVAVTGDYNDTEWGVGPTAAPGATIASGPISCAQLQCAFSITTLLDQPAGIQVPSMTLGRPITGSLQGFATRRAWVSAVTGWAERAVDPGVRDKIVSQAARVQAGDQ